MTTDGSTSSIAFEWSQHVGLMDEDLAEGDDRGRADDVESPSRRRSQPTRQFDQRLVTQ